MKKYLYTQKENITWFVVPKTATRSMHAFFKQNNLKFPNETFKNFKKQNNTFTFVFVRNPWDRLVSTYENKVRLQWENKTFSKLPNAKYRIKFYEQFKGSDFKNFALSICNGDLNENHIKEQLSYFPVNDINFIGRFENLQNDFNTVCKEIGINNTQLPHSNSSQRDYFEALHKSYTEYYDEETRQIVAEKYAKDIEYFSYEFGQ